MRCKNGPTDGYAHAASAARDADYTMSVKDRSSCCVVLVDLRRQYIAELQTQESALPTLREWQARHCIWFIIFIHHVLALSLPLVAGTERARPVNTTATPPSGSRHSTAAAA